MLYTPQAPVLDVRDQNITSILDLIDGTISGSALAIQASLSHSRAQANPTVERGHSHKVRVKKLPKEKATDKSTQTEKQKK